MAELDLKRRPELISFGVIPTPQQSVFGGEILNTEALSGALKALVGKIKTKSKDVVVGLWGTSVVVKKISVPKTEEDLIAEQVKWAADQYVPYEIDEVSIDYKIMNRSPSDSEETINVLLVAATQKSVFSYAECIGLAGLNCQVLDVEGCALSNCLEYNHRDSLKSVYEGKAQSQNSENKEKNENKVAVGVLDLGSSTTNFIVIQNGEIIFCRDIPVGGDTYTNELQKSLNVNTHEAESLQMNVSSGKEVPEEALSIIQASHDIIIDEIKGNIDFCVNTFHLSSIDQFFITGGCTKIPGLFPLMEENFNCKKLDPFHRVHYNGKKFSEQYIDHIRDFSAVSVGLGIRF